MVALIDRITQPGMKLKLYIALARSGALAVVWIEANDERRKVLSKQYESMGLSEPKVGKGGSLARGYIATAF